MVKYNLYTIYGTERKGEAQSDDRLLLGASGRGVARI